MKALNYAVDECGDASKLLDAVYAVSVFASPSRYGISLMPRMHTVGYLSFGPIEKKLCFL